MSSQETFGLYVFYGVLFTFLFAVAGQRLLSARISRRVQDRHPQAWRVATRGFQEARIDTRRMSYEQEVDSLGDPTLTLMARLRLGLRLLAAAAVIGGLAWLALELRRS